MDSERMHGGANPTYETAWGGPSGYAPPQYIPGAWADLATVDSERMHGGANPTYETDA